MKCKIFWNKPLKQHRISSFCMSFEYSTALRASSHILCSCCLLAPGLSSKSPSQPFTVVAEQSSGENMEQMLPQDHCRHFCPAIPLLAGTIKVCLTVNKDSCILHSPGRSFSGLPHRNLFQVYQLSVTCFKMGAFFFSFFSAQVFTPDPDVFKEKTNKQTTFCTDRVSKEGVRASSSKMDSVFPWLLFPVWFQLSLVLVPKLCKAFCLAVEWNAFQTGSPSARVNFYSKFKAKSIRTFRVITLRIKYTELLNHKRRPSQHLCYYSKPKWQCLLCKWHCLFLSVCSFLGFSVSGASFLTHRMNWAKGQEQRARAPCFPSTYTGR